MARWVHDNLPYSELEFFPRFWAFNIGWHEKPMRKAFSHTEPKGYLALPEIAEPTVVPLVRR